MATRLAIVVGITCVLLAAVPAAQAGNPPAVTDCTSHGRLTQHYSVSQLRTALTEMPADVQEYTNCYDVIRHALLAQVPGSHSGAATAPSGSGGGSSVPTAVIVAIVVVVLGGATAAAVAVRRRGAPPSR